jgi:two-component system, OmpR family, sensor kinase
VRAMSSIANRLALLFLAVTLGAMAFMYFYVAPSLESSLRDEKLRNLAASAQRYSEPVQRALDDDAPAPRLDAAVRRAADMASVRVTLLGVGTGTFGLQISTRSDSATTGNAGSLRFAVASRAARTGRLQTGSEEGPQGRVGQAAIPLLYRPPGSTQRVVGSVAVFSEPLTDVEGNVALIRRRMLVAGAIALIVAVLAGYFIARALSQRIKRLERVARRVAGGDFSGRFHTGRDDELGQLAAALDDMQRQLAELDSARKRFIAIASHELRTPLFSLGGFIELLQDEELDDETRDRFLGQLREQVDRLGKLATGLLDLSKLEAGSLELRPQRTDLGELARNVSNEFTPALAQHDSHLEVRLPGGPVKAVCDPERVAQVMRILIDNSLTHTPKGTDMVVVAGRRNGRVRLAVGDFGPGIDQTMLPRIFEPFITSDDAQGSGLGLAIAHELAERMHGKLAVETSPGHTLFSLELPG